MKYTTYIYIYIHMDICICINNYIYEYVYIYIYVYLYSCVYVYTVYIYIYKRLCPTDEWIKNLSEGNYSHPPALQLPMIKLRIARSFSPSSWCFTCSPGDLLKSRMTFFNLDSVLPEPSEACRSIILLNRRAIWRQLGACLSAPLNERRMFRNDCMSFDIPISISAMARK